MAQQKINLEQTTIDEVTSSSDIGINTGPLSNVSGNNIQDAVASIDTALASAGAEADPTVDIMENVSANDVICKLSNGIEVAKADKRYGSKIEIIGITTQTKTSGAGQTLSLKRSGIMGGFVGLTPSLPVFLGNEGGITQDPFLINSDEYRVYLGVAFSTTEIIVNISEAMRMGAGMGASLSGVGMQSYFSADAIGYGFLVEDGRSLLRTDFSELFSVIGTTYGAVDSEHFNLRDSRDKFIRAGRMPVEFLPGDVTTGTDVINLPAHGIVRDGTPVRFSGDDLPDPLVEGTIYYAWVVDVDNIEVCATETQAIANTPSINLTDAGTGTHTIHFTGMNMDSAMWNHLHSHNIGASGFLTADDNNIDQPAGGTTADFETLYIGSPTANGIYGTPNVSNESRPEHTVMVSCIRYLPFPVALNKLDAGPVWEVGQPYVEKPTDATLWEFSSPSLANNLGENPVVEGTSVYWNPAGDANNKWTNRGTVYTGDSHIGGLVYDYDFSNNVGYIKFRFKPDFNYDVGGIQNIITIRSTSGTGFQGIFFIYNNTTDQLMLDMYSVDGANKIAIVSDAFTDNPSLQKWHDIVLTWDGPGNDADFYLNGVQQGGGVEGTKTPTGTITGLNITATKLAIANGFANLILDDGATASVYITDMLMGDTWNDSTTNYDGSANTLPNANRNRAMGNETNFSLDKYGNLAAKTGHFDDLFMKGARIIESGSNANGDYIKFADGTMFCRGTSGNYATSTVTGAIYWWAAVHTWTYPVVFTVTPYIVDGGNYFGASQSSNSNTSVGLRAFGAGAGSNASVRLLAVGRWRD